MPRRRDSRDQGAYPRGPERPPEGTGEALGKAPSDVSEADEGNTEVAERAHGIGL